MTTLGKLFTNKNDKLTRIENELNELLNVIVTESYTILLGLGVVKIRTVPSKGP